MDQPDNFEPHPQKEHLRQPRPILTSQNNNCQSSKLTKSKLNIH